MTLLPPALGALLGNRASFSITIDGIQDPRVVRFSGYEGISAPYEVPESPELQAVGAGILEEQRDRVIAMLRDAGKI